MRTVPGIGGNVRRKREGFSGLLLKATAAAVTLQGRIEEGPQFKGNQNV